jgi:histone H3/H4
MSNVPVNPESDLQEIIEWANKELQNAHSMPFSEQAFRRLKDLIGAYAVELINESVKKAKRHQAEGVSSSDVQQASQYLVSSTSHRIFRHAGAFGGLLLGTAFSNIVSMLTTNQYNLRGIVVTFILTLIGTFLIAAHILKD